MPGPSLEQASPRHPGLASTRLREVAPGRPGLASTGLREAAGKTASRTLVVATSGTNMTKHHCNTTKGPVEATQGYTSVRPTLQAERSLWSETIGVDDDGGPLKRLKSETIAVYILNFAAEAWGPRHRLPKPGRGYANFRAGPCRPGTLRGFAEEKRHKNVGKLEGFSANLASTRLRKAAGTSSLSEVRKVVLSAFPKGTRSVAWQDSNPGPLGSDSICQSCWLAHLTPELNVMETIITP
ncbi:hypothetical protein Bbelb_252580 [Branchiostoma belcheri]|nr:hypothetical protein Bbelb_252580 [Branchiostoma belcheri]